MKIEATSPRKLYNKLRNGLRKLNFNKLTEQEKIEKKDIVGYVPPKGVSRIIETGPQVEFQEQIGEYIIQILTSYREDTKDFTKNGKIWCQILGPKVDVGLDTKYTRLIYRVGDFITKALHEAEFLVYALRCRPFDSKKRPMILKEYPRGFFFWVSVSNESEKISLYHAIPPSITKEIVQNKNEREYYIKKVRKRKGIKTWARDRRKRGTKKTPNNAVPVVI